MRQREERIRRCHNDPLFSANCSKRAIKKKIKKIREKMEFSVITYGMHLKEQLKQLDEVNELIKKLKKEEN